MRRLRILQIFSRYIHFGGEESFVRTFRDASLPFHDVTDTKGQRRSFSVGLSLVISLPPSGPGTILKSPKILHRYKKTIASTCGWFTTPFPLSPPPFIRPLFNSKSPSFTTFTTIECPAPTAFFLITASRANVVWVATSGLPSRPPAGATATSLAA